MKFELTETLGIEGDEFVSGYADAPAVMVNTILNTLYKYGKKF